MKLPQFPNPSLADLRRWWRARDERAVHLLILEVQRHRLTLLEMRDLIDAGVRDARATNAELVKAGEPLMTLRIRIAQEVLRIGDIDDTPKHDAVSRHVREYARNPDAVEFEAAGRRRAGPKD